MPGILCLGKLPEELAVKSVLDLIQFPDWVFLKFLLNPSFFSSHFNLTAKKFFYNSSIFAMKLCIFNRFSANYFYLSKLVPIGCEKSVKHETMPLFRLEGHHLRHVDPIRVIL